MGAWGLGCEEPVEPSPSILDVPSDYGTIAEALSAACQGDTILIAPGTYLESGLRIPERGVVVRSWDPEDPGVVASTIINGNGEDVVVFEAAFPFLPSTLAGVTLTGGEGAFVAAPRPPSSIIARLPGTRPTTVAVGSTATTPPRRSRAARSPATRPSTMAAGSTAGPPPRRSTTARSPGTRPARMAAGSTSRSPPRRSPTASSGLTTRRRSTTMRARWFSPTPTSMAAGLAKATSTPIRASSPIGDTTIC